MTKIHLRLAHMGGQEQTYIQEAFDSNWIAPLGPNVDKFEKSLEQFLRHKKYATVVSSGTAAIHLALVLLGIQREDEVICPSFTFIASANPVIYQGATPVFVDSDPDSWNMSPILLEQAINERIRITGRVPKAIIVVHLYGMPAMMDEVMEIARHYEIPVIEDAAEAMGAEYNGKLCGTFGHYGIFSFNGNKMITTGGGGVLICPTEVEKQRALFYATQAKEPCSYYQHEYIGYNYRMSNVSAGIGRGQMEVVYEHIEHHRKQASRYQALLAEEEGISVHTNPTLKHNSNYWLSTILIEPHITGVDCTYIQQHLEAKGIESRRLWKPLHLQPVFKGVPNYVNGVSELLFSKGLWLPSGPCVSDSDVVQIVSEIKKCIRK